MKIYLISLLLVLGGTIYSMEQKFGNSKIGYISLPQEFNNFFDVKAAPSQDKQYSNGATIFTLSVFEDKKHTLESAASSIMSGLEKEGVQNLQGATIKFNGYNCLQVYGDYNNSKHKAVAYIFKPNKNIVLLIFEGPVEELEKNLKYAETFSIK